MLVPSFSASPPTLFEFLNWPRKGYQSLRHSRAGPIPSCRDHISLARRKKQVCLQPVLASVEIEVAATQCE